ncbi:hypothetical protein APS67_005257 [Streptomyces sp. AVP053U2]|nr:hypothetical protein APS67_005257 [Streptomyces sp. AVP053U2]
MHGERVGAPQAGEVREEIRDTGGQNLAAGNVRAQRNGIETVHEPGAVAPVTEDPQAAVLGSHQHHALRAQSGQQLVGGLLDHILHARRLGEGGGQMHQVVQHAGTTGTGGGHGPRRGSIAGRVTASDADADAGSVRVQLEVQPHIRRAQDGERLWPTADQGRPVAVLDLGDVRPRQHLPGQGTHQVGPVGTDEVGPGPGDEGDAAVDVQSAGSARQTVGEGRGRCLLGGGGSGPGRRRECPRPAGGQERIVAVRRLLQEGAQAAAARLDDVALLSAGLRWALPGQQQYQSALKRRAPHPTSLICGQHAQPAATARRSRDDHATGAMGRVLAVPDGSVNRSRAEGEHERSEHGGRRPPAHRRQ